MSPPTVTAHLVRPPPQRDTQRGAADRIGVRLSKLMFEVHLLAAGSERVGAIGDAKQGYRFLAPHDSNKGGGIAVPSRAAVR
jgi:hypothetical protein